MRREQFLAWLSIGLIAPEVLTEIAEANVDDPALAIFRDKYLPSLEAAKLVRYKDWQRQNPGEYAKWVSFRDAVLARQQVTPPVLATPFGRMLVAAGEMHMSISHFVGTVTPPLPPPPPPPPPSSYPASFFTGPLGANNLVPADPNGGVIIMWSGIVGNTEQQQRDMHVQRMADCGRSWDGIQFQGPDALAVGGQSGEDWVNSLGIVPCVTWSPGGSISTINSGGSDAAITTMADRYAAKSYRIMVRLFHEFNLPNTSYYHANNPAPWITAWRRVVSIFQQRGADNVGFWWCPTEQAGDPERSTIDACYPGDAYVDWVGTDSYNSDSGFSWPGGSGWASFDQIFNYQQNGQPYDSFCDLWGPRKPFIVGETGSKYNASPANRKANWFREIDSVCKPHMPHLRGIAFFDVMTIPLEPHDWRVDSNQPSGTSTIGSADATTYQGFKDFVGLARWRGGWA